MLLMALFGVRRIGLYGLLAVLLWVAFLQSGIHPTIAGVLAAVTIPSTGKINTGSFRGRSRELLDRFELADADPGTHQLTSEQQEVVFGLAGLIQEVETPLQRLEHALHPWVTFLIMPMFALANAGVVIGAGILQSLMHPVTIGIAMGLVLGKMLGVVVFAWLAVSTGLAERPAGTTWRQFLGVGALAGIGFTMSLFIASLAFGDTPLIDNAKVGILAASVVAGVLGAAILLGSGRRATEP
jgi:NhaA family Na+:H+ antiporter